MVFRGVAASGSFSNVVPLVFGNDGDATNDYISFTSGTRGKIVSKQNSAFFGTLWTNGQLRINGQAGAGSYSASGFLSINRGGGVYELILDAGQIIDDDDDGINDTWGQRRAGETGLLTATGDYDNDGLLDITEYILDYNPLVSNQDFTCAGTFDAGNLNYVISFNATNSRMYRVEYKTNLTSSAAWQFISWQTGSNGLHTLRAPANATKGFFRIQVLAP